MEEGVLDSGFRRNGERFTAVVSASPTATAGRDYGGQVLNLPLQIYLPLLNLETTAIILMKSLIA